MNVQRLKVWKGFLDAGHQRGPYVPANRNRLATRQLWMLGGDSVQKQMVFVVAKAEVKPPNA